MIRNWQQIPSGNIGGANLPPLLGSFYNFKAANNSGTPNTKVDLSPGPYGSVFEVILENVNSPYNVYKAIASSTITINAGTTGANGLDTGAQGASTWYYFYLIYNGSTVAGLLSASSTAPTMPSGYTYRALMGATYSNASTHFVTFNQLGKVVDTPEQMVFTAQTGQTSWTSQTLTTLVPPIASVAKGSAGSTSSSTVGGLQVASDVNGSGASGQTGGNDSGATATFPNWLVASFYRVNLPTVQTVWWITAATGANYGMSITGWEYP